MIRIIEGWAAHSGSTSQALETMFEDRKRLFVDLLGWDVPVVSEKYEIDAFDGPNATYVVHVDETGTHSGSLRLLPTLQPHLLDTLFAPLCIDGVPTGPGLCEITRLCLPVRLGSAQRLAVRNALITGMVDYALAHDLVGLTGVVSASYRRQVMAMGWRCSPLGPDLTIDGHRLGAFRIDLDRDTPAQLAARGIYLPLPRLDCAA